MTSRYQFVKNFPLFKTQKDSRNMDEICQPDSSDFALQLQQKFLKEYMEKHPEWDRLVLFHTAGSGKTCSAITMAEEYLQKYPKNKVRVILPARLRTNFLDELISPCGMDKYISKTDFITYHNSSTSQATKRRIRRAFMAAIQERYDIMSFEKFKNQAQKAASLDEWCNNLTANSIIIIDEVHNLLNPLYSPDNINTIMTEHRLPARAKAINTLLFRYMTKNAHKNCKMVFMTATPIFDNIAQLRELILGVNPNAPVTSSTKLSQGIEYLRGKVSYFPGISPNAYPSVEYETHNVPMSQTQIKETIKVLEVDGDDEYKEAFMSKQRQISLACLPGAKDVPKNIKKIVANLDEYAPKIATLLKQLKSPGKHVVFSNFIKSGLHVVRAALENNGWISLDQAEKIADTSSYKYKIYALWDGSIDDMQKQKIKSIANSKQNIDGSMLKVILGSPSIKEGVSFKHVQHLHMLDPVWNQSAKTQVEGRAIRFCSHVDIDPTKDKTLRRVVVVHLYKSHCTAKNGIEKTCDMMIYDHVIPNKYKTVKAGEDALKSVAIDHYLFRKLYRHTPLTTPEGTPTEQSPIDLKEDVVLNKRQTKQKIKNSCPSKRRPDAFDNCPENMENRLNKHGDPCCYKIRKSKQPKEPKKPQEEKRKRRIQLKSQK